MPSTSPSRGDLVVAETESIKPSKFVTMCDARVPFPTAEGPAITISLPAGFMPATLPQDQLLLSKL
ncbi:unannotated protein [freshwater metagenome]|uniref:Unannotated protein n=1 Tax=freshwater metagenome TaxID=449393 RepID=A0A6J6HUF2_9ZZZZ